MAQFRVKFRVKFRVPGSGFGVQGSRFRVPGSGFGVQGSRFRVQVQESGSGFRVPVWGSPYFSFVFKVR
jgi:hypothetical protein